MKIIKHCMLLMAAYLPFVCLIEDARANEKIIIQIKLSGAGANDTLKLKIGSGISFASEYPERVVYKTSLNEHQMFRFEIPVNSPYGYFSIEKPRTFTDTGLGSTFATIIAPQLWKSGDSILIKASVKETYTGTNGRYSFLGVGAAKYSIGSALDSILSLSTIQSTTERIIKEGIVDPYADLRPVALEYLKSHSIGLSNVELEIFKIKIEFYNGNSVFLPLKNYWQGISNTERSYLIKRYKTAYNSKFNKPHSVFAMAQSVEYLKFTRYRYAAESILVNGTWDFVWIYNTIKVANQDQLLKNAHIAVLFSRDRLPTNSISIMNDAVSFVSGGDAKIIITRIKEKTGQRLFKDFELFDIHDRVVRFSDFKGKTVLIDFWTNGCGGCKMYYETALKYAKEKFVNDTSMVFLSIGVERKKERWIDGLKTGFYTSEDAINLYTGAKGLTHPTLSGNFVKAYPTAILVDKYGYVFKQNTEDLYNRDSLIELIETIK
jgi:thiol-disulfide isomerase/thioredoxin